MQIGDVVQNINTGVVGEVIAIDDQGEYKLALVDEVNKDIDYARYYDFNDLRIVSISERDFLYAETRAEIRKES